MDSPSPMTDASAAAPARLRMEDIAELAGVSTITVSRALRGHPSVRPATREHVAEIARRAGYRMNLPARNLRLARSRIVSVVVGAPSAELETVSDAFPLDLLRAISQELTAASYSLLLATSDDLDATAVQAAEGGILLGQGADDSALHKIAGLQVPFVVWGVERRGDSHATVDTDNRQGGNLAAGRFATLGRERAVFLGDLHHAQVATRAAGFAEAARRLGLEVRNVGSDFTFAGGYRAIERLRSEGHVFDAVFACSDVIALGAVSALRQAGVAVPQEVSVIGYDDTPMAASSIPALTSVHQNWREGGRRLARKVIDLIEGREATSEVLPATLTVRET